VKWLYYLPFYLTTYLNKEVNCTTDPSPSVSFPWLSFRFVGWCVVVSSPCSLIGIINLHFSL